MPVKRNSHNFVGSIIVEIVDVYSAVAAVVKRYCKQMQPCKRLFSRHELD